MQNLSCPFDLSVENVDGGGGVFMTYEAVIPIPPYKY